MTIFSKHGVSTLLIVSCVLMASSSYAGQPPLPLPVPPAPPMVVKASLGCFPRNNIVSVKAGNLVTQERVIVLPKSCKPYNARSNPFGSTDADICRYVQTSGLTGAPLATSVTFNWGDGGPDFTTRIINCAPAQALPGGPLR